MSLPRSRWARPIADRITIDFLGRLRAVLMFGALVVALGATSTANAFDRWVRPSVWSNVGASFGPSSCSGGGGPPGSLLLAPSGHGDYSFPDRALEAAIAFGNANCRPTLGVCGFLTSWSPSGACTVSGAQTGNFFCPYQGTVVTLKLNPDGTCGETQSTTTVDRSVGGSMVCQNLTSDGSVVFNAGARMCECTKGFYMASVNRCVPLKDLLHNPPCDTCVGNPILVGNAAKRQTQDLGWQPWLPVTMTFNSARGVPYEDEATPRFSQAEAQSLPGFWYFDLDREVLISGIDFQIRTFARGNGQLSSFEERMNTFYPTSPAITDVPFRYAEALHLRDPQAQTLEVYDSAYSKVSRIQHANGKWLSFTRASVDTADYPRGAILYVEDQDGRRITMGYQGGKLTRLTDPAGRAVVLDVDAAGVKTVHWPDGTSRQFLYETTDPRLLTGYLNESNVRGGTYGYDEKGRAISTQRAMGTDAYAVQWSSPPRWTVREEYDATEGVIVRHHALQAPGQAQIVYPNTLQENVVMANAGGATKWSEKTQTGADGKTRKTTRKFDGRMNVTELNDYNGARSCMTYEAGRSVESSRVEGLGENDDCGSLSTLPAGARKISTQWHPQWNLPTRIAEPGRITTLVYNGQPDPLNGNATAACALNAPRLSDNTPIAVLCKRVEQATTDTTGAAGFSATLQSGIATRAWSWTYNGTGQVLTAKDPRGITTVVNEYYTDTTVDHTRGDLKTSTNVAGHMTSFPRYDAYGQPLEMIDANGISTVYVYDARQRVSSVAVAGATTTYEYWPTGQVKRTVQPDASAVNYEYDAAQRLTAVSDTLGNRIEYTLDVSGQRTKEQAKDPQGTLKRTMSRAFDALGRTQQTTGRE